MKKAFIEGMCCKGCANQVKHIFKNLYGITNVEISADLKYVTFEGYVSKRIIAEALNKTTYKLIRIEKVEK